MELATIDLEQQPLFNNDNLPGKGLERPTFSFPVAPPPPAPPPTEGTQLILAIKPHRGSKIVSNSKKRCFAFASLFVASTVLSGLDTAITVIHFNNAPFLTRGAEIATIGILAFTAAISAYKAYHARQQWLAGVAPPSYKYIRS
ncbi:hypothetical protein FNU76_12510 [Chitinimonas arctica]|uniref:Uncharacterized protein n=1 Tax=Chitinimonas arctica TaxID=2594795 RepID=A0A516SGG7_9NEIS|nr:hypothetical protein [Chitinimonas arctica]QDQ27118.1 hypothetical protein FNU76_12510 [Chitinimonas arctica]